MQPKNIFLLDKNGGAKVGDTGITTSTAAAAAVGNECEWGSPTWMAPETRAADAAGRTFATCASDVFSFGLVMAAVLAGIQWSAVYAAKEAEIKDSMGWCAIGCAAHTLSTCTAFDSITCNCTLMLLFDEW